MVANCDAQYFTSHIVNYILLTAMPLDTCWSGRGSVMRRNFFAQLFPSFSANVRKFVLVFTSCLRQSSCTINWIALRFIWCLWRRLRSVSKSVRPSSAGIVSKRMDISSHFGRSGRDIALVFEPQHRYNILRWTPSAGALKYTRMGKFRKYRFSCRRRYEIGPCLLWITSKKSYAAERSDSESVTMTLSDWVN